MANLGNMQQHGCYPQEDFGFPPLSTQLSEWDIHLLFNEKIEAVQTIQDKINCVMSKFPLFYQFWVPVTVEGRKFLTTSDQPYSGCEYYNQQYRKVSSTHRYSTDIGKEDQLGPPGRVFLRGWPELSQNVKYYSTKEYHLRDCALSYGLKKYCALPIFCSTGEDIPCVGVLEFLADDGTYSIPNMCRQVMVALEAASLASSRNFSCRCTGMNIPAPCAATIEIQTLLEHLCEVFRLPLAQAWAPCTSKHEARQLFLVHGFYSMSDYDSNDPFSFLVDSTYLTPLQEGKGLVGKAFVARDSCFCKDITQYFPIMDYPYMHYARECKLTSCFAIFLHGIDPNFGSCILELFLAPGGMDCPDPQDLLQSMLDKMVPYLHNFNFKVAIDQGQQKHGRILTHEVHLCDSNENVDYFQTSQSWRSLNESDGKKLEDAVGDGITLKLVKQQFGKKLDDAARSLGVSRSTLKED